MKKYRILVLAVTIILMTACGKETEGNRMENSVEKQPQTTEAPQSSEETVVTEKEPENTPVPTQEPVKEEPAQPLYVDFTQGAPTGYEIADGWTNGSMFNVTWRKKNVTFENDCMQLIVDKDATPSGDIPYSGGEFRTRKFYGYGRYEVSMKAIKNDGVVSSFFTYTGPSDNNPWDEIDIEILGKDTTKVQFNYFTNGRGNNEYLHELGFDASEDFHTYAFEWHEDKIIWFVDGIEVHSADKRIPVTKGKIMMNAWCGTGVDTWLKAFDDSNLPVMAEYQWIKYTPFE